MEQNASWALDTEESSEFPELLSICHREPSSNCSSAAGHIPLHHGGEKDSTVTQDEGEKADFYWFPSSDRGKLLHSVMNVCLCARGASISWDCPLMCSRERAEVIREYIAGGWWKYPSSLLLCPWPVYIRVSFLLFLVSCGNSFKKILLMCI